MKNQNNQNQSENTTSKVTQKRGPELGKEMLESQKKGEEYRAEHQGRDVRETANTTKSEKTSNTNKSHKTNH